MAQQFRYALPMSDADDDGGGNVELRPEQAGNMVLRTDPIKRMRILAAIERDDREKKRGGWIPSSVVFPWELKT